MAKATAGNNLRVILDAFVKTNKERLEKEKKEKSRAKSKPDSNPAKRGAQGPRQATSNPTNTRRTLSVSGDTGRRGATDAQGRPKNQPPKPAPRNAPPTQKYKPRVSNVGPQIRQADKVRSIQANRDHRLQVKAGKVPANETPGQRIRRTGGTYRGIKYPGGGKPGVRIGASARTRATGTRGGASRGANRSSALRNTLTGGLVTAAAVGSLRNPVTKAKANATRKEGQKATLNGKPVVWRKGKWVPAPSQSAGKYNTRDADGTVRSRARVGPKIVGPKTVGPKTVGTAEQAFDKAYAAAKKAGKKTFTFNGKKYSTK